MSLDERATSPLLQRAQDGDTSAREQLVRLHDGLIWSAVRRLQGSGEDPEDLYQVGCMGLVKAIDRFDASYQVQFSTYAVPLIVGEIRRYLRDQGQMRVSRSLKSLAHRISRVRHQLTAQLGREPSVAQVAEELGVAPAEIALALEASRPLLHLETQVGGDARDPVYLQDRIAHPSAGETAWIDRVLLQESLSSLDPRLSQIIQLRFFADRTQSEIALTLGISQAQVSRLEQRALVLIRRMLQEQTLQA